MLSFLKGTTDAAFKGVEILTPFITQMDDGNKSIATTLLDAGYSQKQIQRFIDVSTTQFEEWAEIEVEVRARIEESTRAMEARDRFIKVRQSAAAKTTAAATATLEVTEPTIETPIEA